MPYREHAPPAELLREVECLWTVEGDGGAARVLPDGCLDVLFDLDAGTGRVVGAMTSAVWVGEGARRVLGVRFRPGEAPAFLGVPASELTDRAVSLREITPSTVAEELAEARAVGDRAAVVGRFLRAVRGARRSDPRVRAAVPLLERGVPVARVAEEVGLGERQLERAFSERVGLGPKRFARVARLRRLVAALGPDVPDWATLAYALGFADQPHLAREVRALAGVTPGALWREIASMSETSNAATPGSAT